MILTDHFFMDLGFSDHAVFTDLAPARFELWLDQTYHLTPSFNRFLAGINILVSEMKDTSTLAKSRASGISSGVT